MIRRRYINVILLLIMFLMTCIPFSISSVFLVNNGIRGVEPAPILQSLASSPRSNISSITVSQGSLTYNGINTFGDTRNLQYYTSNDYDAYGIFAKTTSSSFISEFTYQFNSSYYNISQISIDFKEKKLYGNRPLRIWIKNCTSGIFVDLGIDLGTQTTFQFHHFTISNTTYPDMDSFFNLTTDQVILQLDSATATGIKSWMIDWTDLSVIGKKDTQPPIIQNFTRNVTAPYNNETIEFNVTATDDLSGIASVTLQYCGDVGLIAPIQFDHDITSSLSGSSYYDEQDLLDGDWNVTAIVTDAKGNSANQTMNFTVLGGLLPSVVVLTRNSSILRNQKATLDIYISAGDSNHNDLWIFDPLSSSNVTIDSNINNKQTLQYTFESNLAVFLGEYQFIAYLSDKSSREVSSQPVNVSVVKDSTKPEIDLLPNDLKVGINKTINISFLTNTTNKEFNLSYAWYLDVNLNVSTILNSSINSNTFNIFLNLSKTSEGYFDFKFYANDSGGNQAVKTLILIWEVLAIAPKINVYTDRLSNYVFQKITLYISVEGTEYDLNDVWFYNPFTYQQELLKENIGNKSLLLIEYDLYGLEQGDYIITIQVNDIWGNMEDVSIPLSFYLVEPFLTQTELWQMIMIGTFFLIGLGFTTYLTYKQFRGTEQERRMKKFKPY
jgi:hypothetical protein